MSDCKQWVCRFVACVFIGFMVIVSALEIILYRLNENMVETELAVSYQLEHNALYGSMFQDNPSYLKLHMALRKRPEILAIGSSRIMQLREPFFQGKTFYNMGLSELCIDDVKLCFDDVTKNNDYDPDILILEFDWCLFNPNFKYSNRYNYDEAHYSMLQEKIYQYRRIKAELKPASDLVKRIINPNTVNNEMFGYKNTIGYAAALSRSGFRADGSYLYGKILLDNQDKEARLKPTFDRINEANKAGRFVPCDGIDNSRLVEVDDFLKHIKKQSNCKIIVFLPPFPHAVYEKLLQTPGQRNLILEYESGVKEICEANGVTFYDFSDMSWVGSPDDECIDGFHGSERTYARMMLKMVDDDVLGPYINSSYIQQRLEDPIDMLHVLPYNE